MIKSLTCIECPKGCRLSVEVDAAGRVVRVEGNQCPKGDRYGQEEVINPRRVLTTTVLAQGLELKMVPVRTDQPISRARIFDAMAEARKIRISRPVRAGDVVVANFLGLEVNLIATRAVDLARG